MGRPESPIDPEAGPVQRFAWQLRQLRDGAGNPSYRTLARRAHYSASTLAEAAKGDRLPTLEVALAYVEACGGDQDLWRARWSAAAEPVPVAPRGPEERCPYPGLMALQPEQADWFFGRSELVRGLLDRVDRLPVLALLAASGSGKSSLLRAGLLGAIAADQGRSRRWRTMLMTPTENPLRSLSDQVAKLSGDDVEAIGEAMATDPAGLDIAIRAALAGGPEQNRALLVVDQFEEVFTLCTDEAERERFISLLLDSAQGPQRRTTVVLGIRADFLGQVAQHPSLVRALADEAQVLMGPMSPDELREVVIRPAAQVGLAVEPDLVTTVLADAAAEPGGLPLVSHALRETWRHRTGPTLTVAAYEASGGVRGAIAQTAERLYGDLRPDQRDAVRRIFLRLTALGVGTEDTRRRIGRAELDGIAGPSVIADVLDRLAAARLIVLGDGTVEVAHEALIRAWPRLNRWLSDDRANLVIHRRLTEAAQTWLSLDRDLGALYRGAQLYAARSWAQDNPAELNQVESVFLQRSEALADSEHSAARRHARLLRRLVAAMAGLLVLALLGGSVAVVQRQRAQREQRNALAGELSLRARSLLATDPVLGGLLAVEAEHLNSDVATRGAVLSAAAARTRMQLNVGGPGINAVTFSPDHSVLAAAVGDGTVGLWDPVRGTRIASLSGHQGRTFGVAFSRDGNRIVSTGMDATNGSVIVWDAHSHAQVRTFAEKTITFALAVNPDASLVALGVAGGDIALYNVASGARSVLHAFKAGVTSLSFSADGRLLASANAVEQAIVFNVATWTPVAHLDARHVYSVSFGPTGTTLAGSADEQGVFLWDLAGDHAVALAPLPLAGSYGWAVSAPTADSIAVGDENGGLAIWDLKTYRRRLIYSDRGRSETESVAMSQDGAMLASAGYNGTIVVHDLRDTPFAGFDAQVKDVKVSPDGTVVATAGTDNAVRLWDDRGHPLATLGGAPDEVAAVAFSPDGHLLAALTRNITLTIWDIRNRTHVSEVLHPVALGAATDVAFAPTGGLLAAATLGLSIWDVRDASHPTDTTSKFASRLTTTLNFTPDGRRLVTASTGGFINIWDVATGALLGRTDTHQGALQDIAVSPDGTLIATAGDSRTVVLWRLDADRPGTATTPVKLSTMVGHTAPVQVLAFSRDGRTLASAGDDHSIMLWDVATHRSIATLTGHTARIRGLAFTSAGSLLSGGEDGRIVNWSLDLVAAADHVCATAGRDLTTDEWATYLPSLPYHPTCGPAPAR